MLSVKALSSAGGKLAPTFVSSSNNYVTTAGNTVTAPSGIQNDDLIIAVGFNSNNAAVTVTPPTGFNVQYLTGTAENTLFIASKVASSESGNYTWTWSVATNNTVSMFVYRNATAINTIGDITRVSQTAPSITPTYTGTLIAAFASELGTTGGASIVSGPSGMTLRDSRAATSASVAIYDLSNQAAAATGDKTISWSGGSSVASILFQVTNESIVAPEFIASASTQNTVVGNLVIAKPTGTVEGDLMIAAMAADVGATWTGDTGWTEIAAQGSGASNGPGLRIAYKVAGASEGSSYTFVSSSTRAGIGGCILTYRYASYDTIAGAFTTAATPLVLTSISPSASQSILIAVGGRTSASITLGTPTSMTARVTDNDATAPSYIVLSQTVAKGPVGTRSMTTGATSGVSGIMLSIKPTRSLT